MKYPGKEAYHFPAGSSHTSPCTSPYFRSPEYREKKPNGSGKQGSQQAQQFPENRTMAKNPTKKKPKRETMTIKTLITLSFLLIACYTDLITRKVPNKITFIWIITALIFAGYEVHQGTPYLLTVGLSWASMSLITGLLFRAGKLGGGDVKALIALSLLYPIKALWILSLAYLLTLCSKAGKENIQNFPFMLPITGGFLLTLL